MSTLSRSLPGMTLGAPPTLVELVRSVCDCLDAGEASAVILFVPDTPDDYLAGEAARARFEWRLAGRMRVCTSPLVAPGNVIVAHDEERES